jgi:hypothetical protein
MSENVRVDSWHSKREFGKKWKRDLGLLAARLTMKYPENTLDNVRRYEHFASDEERVIILKKIKHLMSLRQHNNQFLKHQLVSN